MSEKSELINYTLRLPEEYRRRLELEAEARGRSLNQQIIRIIEMFFANSGYASTNIRSAGQLFQIHSALSHSTQAETVWEFAFENFKTGKEEAHYMIGLEQQVLKHLKVSDPKQAVNEIGLALLHSYANRGRDIRTLSWTQNPAFDGKRVITENELPENIHNVPDYLEYIAKGQFEDILLVPDDEIEATKTLLLAARLEQSPIIKHMDDPEGLWVEVGSKRFNEADKAVFARALSKMKMMRLVHLQPVQDRSINTYVLTPEALQYLARIASWASV
ncbi:MAG: Arc family DNA-binding protein [Candidatus Obscuribacterales bacterium]|nr:Arc family DNA-binding protein [Candidatus Obscuribacterales bacterium]